MNKKQLFIIIFLVAIFCCLANVLPEEAIGKVGAFLGRVALTFDDGPSPETTPQVIEILGKFGARATFFVVGRNVNLFPGILREAVRSGNEIADHTYNHPKISKLNAKMINAQLHATQNAIFRSIGVNAKFFRPPYGAINEKASKIAQTFGLKIVMWSIDPFDWQDPAPETIEERVLSNIQPGDIVLLHDVHRNTVYALPYILEGLKRKGLRCVTVSELLR